MSGPYAIGSLDPLPVRTFSGFDYKGVYTRQRLLSDGTSADKNEVIQSSGLPGREAQVAGPIRSHDDLATLRGYYEAASVVAFITPDAVSRNVLIVDFSGPVIWPDPIIDEYTMTVVEV